jgi:hypothetical protein
MRVRSVLPVCLLQPWDAEWADVASNCWRRRLLLLLLCIRRGCIQHRRNVRRSLLLLLKLQQLPLKL